ncbi:hypothetical protein PV396_27840 [Streptomyces sp. ME02-8801-2C]|uniref:hypothetical protein n=1 Tax=Streptomyces sp. ME02-8801-2C TaxID=3028680 RepID=UPI0029A8C46E|nr:hypothetical protein [Streptomyces sp. ME02-8801-2C]MDX3455706.1 hypothetical protein [Streptomyces sp. ME02-8801-2C]
MFAALADPASRVYYDKEINQGKATLTIETVARTPQVNLTIAGVRSRLIPTVFTMKPWIRHATSR